MFVRTATRRAAVLAGPARRWTAASSSVASAAAAAAAAGDRSNTLARIAATVAGVGVGALLFESHNAEGADAAAAAAAAAEIIVGDDAPVGEHSDRWRNVIDNCVPAIVSLKMNSPRNFDTEKPGASQATGFVVDKERGLILTNRHVVHEGPVIAEAIFHNHERVPVKAVYRDPVHDF
eukprot:gene26731-20997_t